MTSRGAVPMLLLVLSATLAGTRAACLDLLPPDEATPCDVQQQLGKCDREWMIAGDFCALSCGRCTATETEAAVEDSAPAAEQEQVIVAEAADPIALLTPLAEPTPEAIPDQEPEAQVQVTPDPVAAPPIPISPPPAPTSELQLAAAALADDAEGIFTAPAQLLGSVVLTGSAAAPPIAASTTPERPGAPPEPAAKQQQQPDRPAR
jgi:hypothetical protein